MYYETNYGDELYHAENGNGSRKNHKYIARVRVGNKYRYFYSQAEIAAYKAAKAVGGAAKAAGSAVTNSSVGRAIGIGGKSRIENAQKEANQKDREYQIAVEKWKQRPGDKPAQLMGGSPDDYEHKKMLDKLYGTHSARYTRSEMIDKKRDESNAADWKLAKAKEQYRNSLAGRIESAGKELAKATGVTQRGRVDSARKELRDALSMKNKNYGTNRTSQRANKSRSVLAAKARLDHQLSLYRNTPLGKIESAANSIKKGASQVAKTVSNVGSQAVSTITSGGSKLLSAGKSLLSGLFGKKKK